MKTPFLASVIRASGIYDAVVLLPFAIPGLSVLVISYLGSLHQWLGFSGGVPPFDPFHMVFVNLLGAISVMWGVLRARDPQWIYGYYDTIIRLTIAAIMLLYLLYYEVTPILWVFFVVEFAWALLQIYAYKKS